MFLFYFCSYMNGCHGADSGSYGQFFANTLKGQSPHEATYPYLNTNPKLTCPSNQKIYNSGAYVASALPDYACTEAKLMTLVSTYGAAVSYVYASDDGFGNYANGVFDGCTSQNIDHAVLVVGYGTDATSGKNYWLVKNSWGPNWGSNGFIKIFRGNNQCGIGNFCYAAKCTGSSGTISEPPVVPPPPPVPVSLTCNLTKYWPTLTGNYIFNFTGNMLCFENLYTSLFEVLILYITLPKLLSMLIGTYTYVTCTNGICRPTQAGPSNACMYICGKVEC